MTHKFKRTTPRADWKISRVGHTRRRRNYTVESLSLRSGIGESTISKLERAERDADWNSMLGTQLGTWQCLAQALNVQLRTLMPKLDPTKRGR